MKPAPSVHQGMYIKSTYDGLHVITGTTEGVSHMVSFLLGTRRLLFTNSDLDIGFQDYLPLIIL